MKDRIAGIAAGSLLLLCTMTQARQSAQWTPGAQRIKTAAASQKPGGERPSQGEVEYGVDGTAWKQLGDAGGAQKLILVRGIYDGLMYGGSPQMRDYYTKTSFENLVSALDRFFADPLNEKIFVVWGLQYVSSQMKGASEAALYLQLYHLRRSAGNRQIPTK
jgi:hypothetical protein